jgi:hypothetical protein
MMIGPPVDGRFYHAKNQLAFVKSNYPHIHLLSYPGPPGAPPVVHTHFAAPALDQATISMLKPFNRFHQYIRASPLTSLPPRALAIPVLFVSLYAYELSRDGRLTAPRLA